MGIKKDRLGFHNKYQGETCVIIGNGPSLDETPLEDLAKLYYTFGSNKIYRKPFIPDFYSIVDAEMMAACDPLPNEILYDSRLFLRAEARIPSNNYLYPVVMAGFSLDPNNFVVMGGTVTFVLLQLAFYMGFRTCLMVGLDHRYPEASKHGLVPFVAGKHDRDHFTCADGKPYFDEGKTFNPPELNGTAQAYRIADELFTKAGRQILNLTPNSALDVFEKDNLIEWC